jgi:alpha-galactosidase
MQKKHWFVTLLSLSCWMLLPLQTVVAQAKEEAILPTSAPKGWIVSTRSATYQIIVDDKGVVKPVFFGTRPAKDQARNAAWFQGVDEVPVRGGYPGKTPMLEVVFSDQVRDLDLVFVDGEMTSIDGKPALKIRQKDRHYPIEVESYIRVIADVDVLEKWSVVRNTGKKDPIKVENFQSGSIVLPADEYQLSHLAGKWGHEFQLQKTRLTPGVKTLQAVDFKSFANPAWFMLRPDGSKDPFSGPAWYGSIQYSGNWRIDFNQFYDRNVQVTSGIHFWDTEINLKAGVSFETPKFIIGYTDKGAEQAAQNLSAYVRRNVLPAEHRNDLRPVLYNSWYATEFHVNEEQQLALAKVAKDVGVELFVIDDGWFKGRVNDRAGLGDWGVDKTKFPNGLSPMIKKINDMGMDFGIWIEPEMVNPNSDLYRKHSDWVFHFPNRKRAESRNQLMLNLAREDVYQYLLQSFTKLLKEHNIKFIKWDHNRTLSEPGWPGVPADQQRAVRIRYIENLYRLVDELKKQFPDVWFETCSSGGGRADYGMLARMDQAWASDNTDPVSRLFIHHGYLSMLPANTMVSWVTREDWHQQTGLDYKFDVSMSGVLGIGNDLTKWGEAEKNIARQKVALYKQIRPLVQQGIAYRLVSPYEENRSAVQYTAEDGTSSVLFCYNMAHYLNQSKIETRGNRTIQLKGLRPDRRYKIEKPGLEAAAQDKQEYTGDFLMNVGIAWPVNGSYKSQVLVISEAGTEKGSTK